MNINNLLSNPLGTDFHHENDCHKGNAAAAPSGKQAQKIPSTSVSISEPARAALINHDTLQRHEQLSKADLQFLRFKTNKQMSDFCQLIATNRNDTQRFLPQNASAERLALVQQAIDYAVDLSLGRANQVPNPFADMPRNDLSAMVHDDSGAYTLPERNAAQAELSRQDQVNVAKLFSTYSGDDHALFASLIDHFDRMPAIDQAAYPDGYRDHLEQLSHQNPKHPEPFSFIQYLLQTTHEPSQGPAPDRIPTPLHTLLQRAAEQAATSADPKR